MEKNCLSQLDLWDDKNIWETLELEMFKDFKM